jgi:hypothetical protein
LLSTLGGSGLEMKWFGTYIWHGSIVARRDFRFLEIPILVSSTPHKQIYQGGFEDRI